MDLARRKELSIAMREIAKGFVAALPIAPAKSLGNPALDMDLSKSTNDPQRQEIYKAVDDAYIVGQILKKDVRDLKSFDNVRNLLSKHSELSKAMAAATSGSGSDWVPTGFSADLIDKIRLELKVANLFDTVNMPYNPYTFPIVSSDMIGYLIPEQTVDGESATRITSSSTGTTSVTLTAKKAGARVYFSEELNEDSIVPILPLLKKNIVIALAAAVETGTINGDVSGTHQDSNVTAASDFRKAWKGIRKFAIAGSARVDLATFDVAGLRNMRKLMGIYGVNPGDLAWIVGVIGYTKLLGLTEVVTMDKYGVNATIVTGELAKLDGIPVIVSEYIFENLNASGVYDGTTTNKTQIVLTNRRALIYGDRRQVTMKTDENVETDQSVLVATQRRALACVVAGANPTIAAQGYNVGT